MQKDLNHLKHWVVEKLIGKGLTANATFEVIQYLAHSVFIDPQVSAFDLKEALYQSNFPTVYLEEDLFETVKECLKREGRKGLEYRYGKGFSYLRTPNPNIA